jgi:type IV pilus assembly protein PilX
MSTQHIDTRARERGMVLVTALLMLVVVTLIALAMFRSVGLDEKMAGNLREKQRALNAAETAEQYAEFWLANGGSASSVPIPCTGMMTASTAQVCTNYIPSAAVLPWVSSTGTTVGVTYTPIAPSLFNVNTTPAMGTYYQQPQYYITYLGQTVGGLGKIYQIDAAAWGALPDTLAVVETTYIVQTAVQDLGSNQ